MFENWQKLVFSNKIDLVHEKITYYNRLVVWLKSCITWWKFGATEQMTGENNLQK